MPLMILLSPPAFAIRRFYKMMRTGEKDADYACAFFAATMISLFEAWRHCEFYSPLFRHAHTPRRAYCYTSALPASRFDCRRAARMPLTSPFR